MAFRTRDLVDNQFSRTNRLLANRQQRLGDDGSNKSDGSIYTILLGLGVLGGIATWWYYPEFFNFRQGMSEEQRKLRKSVKKFRLKLKKPSEMLKLCKSTLNNNIISYNENKRDLNKLGSELNVLVGEEVRTPFGRGTVKKWRDSDGMVEIKLIWNALLVTKPLGLPNVTNNISGESGVEGSSYYFFRSDGTKVKNKWDSYDIDAELKKLDEVDSDEDKNSSKLNGKTVPSLLDKEYTTKLKPAKKILNNLQKVKLKLERLQLKLDSIPIDSMSVGKPPNEKMENLYQSVRKRRKILINNIELILVELETNIAFCQRMVEALT